MGLGGIPQPKASKGTFRKERARKQASVSYQEMKLKRITKELDGYRCRYPNCHRTQVHSAHLTHKGLGGDPKLLRTTLETLITLCPEHHAMFDRRAVGWWLVIIPVIKASGARGPCMFWVVPPASRDVRFYPMVGVTSPARVA